MHKMTSKDWFLVYLLRMNSKVDDRWKKYNLIGQFNL